MLQHRSGCFLVFFLIVGRVPDWASDFDFIKEHKKRKFDRPVDAMMVVQEHREKLANDRVQSSTVSTSPGKPLEAFTVALAGKLSKKQNDLKKFAVLISAIFRSLILWSLLYLSPVSWTFSSLCVSPVFFPASFLMEVECVLSEYEFIFYFFV